MRLRAESRYFLQAGYDVRAVDADPSAIQSVRSMAAVLAPDLPSGNFRVEPVEGSRHPVRS